MKRIILTSAIISIAVNLTGLLTNLFTYANFRKMYLYRRLSGGEWMGWQGFGLLMEKTFPMTTINDPATSGRTWLSLDPISLAVPLIVVFLAVFTVLFVIRMIRKSVQARKTVR
ncbi:MAG: hypothetical protein IKR59_03155 [Lachnospiraceae bacterium]|nr:hypothetical protein [Lachnospiraceae bacterium]